jgi:hypothetical protein
VRAHHGGCPTVECQRSECRGVYHNRLGALGEWCEIYRGGGYCNITSIVQVEWFMDYDLWFGGLVSGPGVWVLESLVLGFWGFGVRGFRGLGVWGSGFGVWGLGFGVRGLGFRVWSSFGFRV